MKKPSLLETVFSLKNGRDQKIKPYCPGFIAFIRPFNDFTFRPAEPEDNFAAISPKIYEMKTINKFSGLISFSIFAVIVTLGAGTGYYTGDYRIGTHIGMALGLIGITAFKLFL